MTAGAKFALACLLSAALTAPALAQSDSQEVPLGDVARAARRNAALPAHTVIDNDNLSQVMDEAATRRMKGQNLLVSGDSAGRTLRISAPDVTCNLSYNSEFSSILSDPLLPRPLPDAELVKLDGPARIDGNSLEVVISNGTSWTLRELTVSITLVRGTAMSARAYGSGRVVPAADVQREGGGRTSDVTVLYHLAGRATPSTRGIFRSDLDMAIAPGQEWHWGIVEAKGLPPQTPQP